jgi:hypothetical protein
VSRGTANPGIFLMGYYYMTGIAEPGKRYHFTVMVDDVSKVLIMFVGRVDRWEITRTETFRPEVKY